MTQPVTQPSHPGVPVPHDTSRIAPLRVPMPEVSETRQRLLAAAEILFYNEGFHAVGLDRILREVGISKQGFYRHFSSKEDLIIEVLRWHEHWWSDQCRHVLEKVGGDDPGRQLAVFANLLLEIMIEEGFRGCFFINAAAQFPNASDPVNRAAVESKEKIERMVRDLALRAGSTDPVGFAQQLLLLFEGAFATRHLRRTSEIVPVVRRLADELFARHAWSARDGPESEPGVGGRLVTPRERG